MIKTVADSKTVAVTGKVVKLVHIYSWSFVCHNLEKNNLKLQINPTAADSTNISHKNDESRKWKWKYIPPATSMKQMERMHYEKAASFHVFWQK